MPAGYLEVDEEPADAAVREAFEETGLRVRGDGTYLVTGGLGGLGLAVAGWLAEQGARHLLLVGQDVSPAAVRLDLAEHPHLLQTPVVAPELSRYNQLFVAEVCDGN
jgi:8-oxo-dGTP pyrophosphatase MutT (NUDIX family)